MQYDKALSLLEKEMVSKKHDKAFLTFRVISDDRSGGFQESHAVRYREILANHKESLFVDFLEVCSKIRGFCTAKDHESPYSAFETLAERGQENACIILAMRHVTDSEKFTVHRAADRARLQHLVAANHPMAKALDVLLGFNPVGEALLSNSPHLATHNAFQRNASAMASLSKLIKQDNAKYQALKAKLA